MTQDELDRAVEAVVARFDSVNQFFIGKIAKQIKKIGKLSQSSINRLTIMAEMNEDIVSVNTRLAKAADMGTRELFRIYDRALNDAYTDPRFARVLSQAPLSPEARAKIEHYARAVSIQTAGRVRNLSNTTIISDTYRRAVDKSIVAVSSGIADYGSATRETVRDLGYNGMQVRYPSGYHRRLDTAVRQNILDGAKQIAQNASIMIGDELGYDAYEISAHLRSAPDHEPVQGKVLLKEEFEKMQAGQAFMDVDGNRYEGFERRIGEWNCMHMVASFSTKHSVRRYPDSLLRKWAADNSRGCQIDGKQYTVYQAGQLMRKIETDIRRQKDAANAAHAAGDDVLRQSCQRKIDALSARYAQVAKASGLTPRRNRTHVEGFRAVRS